ncbi:MAG: 3-deoxy-D-manno-octulosonic acid transferase [Bacteroidetes bacterium]|nr:3-deoxy-D-manno-octulosonic acid transferase [Bacteroidota bacterium]
MHCASLGEFEQGRPLLEALRPAFPDCGLVLTFFSPSGYQVRKDYPGADAVFYLPLDTRQAAEAFVDALQPIAAIFIKYDLWLNHIAVLASKGIPIYLVAARFRQDQVFFKPWGSWHRKGLHQLTRIFCQDHESAALLRELFAKDQQPLPQPAITQAPDTRFDRVLAIAASPRVPETLKAFGAGKPILVAGSTWPADEVLLTELAQRKLLPAGWKLLVAPHEMREAALRELAARLPGRVLRWSEVEAAQPGQTGHAAADKADSAADLVADSAADRADSAVDFPSSPAQTSPTLDANSLLAQADCLIVDKIGLLSSLYALGSAAYIGGGFGAGIHNTLEAAVYGLPLAFGPRYHKFREAEELLSLGAAVSVRNAAQLEQWFQGLLGSGENSAGSPGNTVFLNPAGQASGKAAAAYVEAGRGGTAMVLKALQVDLEGRG